VNRVSEELPQKAELLVKLKKENFNIPDFIYVPAEDFHNRSFASLKAFLEKHQESYKVIARSAHPLEHFFKGGTFDSLETYADVAGVEYARKRMIRLAQTTKKLSILRQQQFNNAPEFDLEDMGVIVMPFVLGTSVMAKMIGDHWEFGYSRDRVHKVHSEPYITKIPHDRRLLEISRDIQKRLGFRCEIEYIVSEDGEIHVVQAKDISNVEILEQKESERSILLDGVHRIRKRRNYRERPLYVMDNRQFYLKIISQCEDIVHGCSGTRPTVEDIIATVKEYEADFERFALCHQRFAVLGLAVHNPDDLYQIANHYLDEIPELQKELSKALYNNLYQVDIFISEADTLIAKDKLRLNLGSHDAYGIDTVRNPLWRVYWKEDRHDEVIREFKRIGFKTGDTVGIDVDIDDRPTVYRL